MFVEEPKINPPKNPTANFRGLKNFQKALNDITQKIKTLEIIILFKVTFPHLVAILTTLETPIPKSPYLNQATYPEENTCQIFPPKKYRHRNFQPSTLPSTLPPLAVKDIQLLGGSKVKPGLASFAGNLSVVNGYLKPLLESAMKIVPADKHISTPIFLFATAGMRLLTKQQSGAIMKEVKKVFNDKTKCPFTFNPETDAKVISGAFEGIYAWISLNFLKGRFIPENSESTLGILEVGGASHQNAFENPSKETFL